MSWLAETVATICLIWCGIIVVVQTVGISAMYADPQKKALFFLLPNEKEFSIFCGANECVFKLAVFVTSPVSRRHPYPQNLAAMRQG